MSQRLVKFATLSDGRLIRILCGAEGENDQQQQQNDGGQGGNTDGGNTGGEGGSTDDGGSSSTGTVSAEEFEKLRLRMQAADRAKSAAEAKIREFEDRDKSTEQRLTGQVETLTAENTKLREELTAARRDNAFLTSNGVTWHDAKLALSKIDWDSVSDSESGEVDTSKLKKEIERIAKESPFLVKTSDSGNGSSSSKQQPPSGHHPRNGGAGGDGKQADRAALEKKYPALRR